MCGEHCVPLPVNLTLPGSSPHVRGAPDAVCRELRGGGIIPACAGSTTRKGYRNTLVGDHPRMCGEHASNDAPVVRSGGSSPHVRGALAPCRAVAAELGIIPACAGSTVIVSTRSRASRDHPRMCGEHTEAQWAKEYEQGSSPHVRGALTPIAPAKASSGIIPACAGSTDSQVGLLVLRGDHPRMCGEHTYSNIEQSWIEGSSPHVRGAPVDHYSAEGGCGIIPACAGSTGRVESARTGSRDHPRMCGEHSATIADASAVAGSSPHVRGALWWFLGLVCQNGIIPACAGSTNASNRTTASSRDHPRMCGEHSMLMVELLDAQGSSPHVRGALRSQGRDAAGPGIIPACAGST